MTAPASPPTPAATERILVVDDEPDIVALVAYHLAKAGYRVATAANGHDALAAARRERPALLVLDLMLPGMSGFDVLTELRADAATRDVAVLLLTARKEEPDRIQGLSLGADDYLTKPFSRRSWCCAWRRSSAGWARRSRRATCSPVGAIDIDRGAHRVSVEGEEVELTPTEFKLCSRSRSDAAGCRRAPTCSRRCGRPPPTSRRARWTCTSSGCARSSAPPATWSRPCAASATG
jgi:two-component system phosphate regulon response regulator PhoB